MKKFIAVCSMLAFGLSAWADPTNHPSYEVRVQGVYDVTAGDDGSKIGADVGMGHFLTDRWQVGGFVSCEKKEWNSWWGVADVWGLWAFVERSFPDWSQRWIPFASLSAGMLDSDNPDKDNVFSTRVSGGVKCVLTDQIGVALQANVDWANSDVYDFKRVSETDGSGKSTDFSIEGGMRFFF